MFEFQFLDIHEIPITTLEETNATLWKGKFLKEDFEEIKKNNVRIFEYKYSLDYLLDETYTGPNNADNILYYNISICTTDNNGKVYDMVSGVAGQTGIETGNIVIPGRKQVGTAIFIYKENEEKIVENLRFNVNVYRNQKYQYRREFMYKIP